MTNELISLAKQFRISVLYDDKFKAADGLTGEDYLLELFRSEAKLRLERATAERIKQAKLPSFKSFDEFDTDFQKSVSREQLNILEKFEWLDSLFNLILLGPPGTGKTHIALSIGNKAARSGYNVFFTMMDNLIHILKTQEISVKSAARVRWISKCDLVIIDELGYKPISRVEANLFFTLISQLYENTSVIITSNKGFDGWAELFGDSVLATALLDRLTHKCQVISLTGESYRLANSKKLF
jgi:DNA replication protein DnaC